MKKIAFGFVLTLLFSSTAFAQKNCEYPVNFTDSIGSYKETKQVIIHEKNFGNTSSYIFFSLVNTNGTPLLNFQNFQKSKDFMTAHCLNQNSKIYLQLLDGNIVTLFNSSPDDNCGSSVRDEQGKNIRITSASFLFLKDGFQKLKKSPVTMIRVKYSSEMIDYIVKSELTSELTNTTYYPEKFFMNYIACVEEKN